MIACRRHHISRSTPIVSRHAARKPPQLAHHIKSHYTDALKPNRATNAGKLCCDEDHGSTWPLQICIRPPTRVQGRAKLLGCAHGVHVRAPTCDRRRMHEDAPLIWTPWRVTSTARGHLKFIASGERPCPAHAMARRAYPDFAATTRRRANLRNKVSLSEANACQSRPWHSARSASGPGTQLSAGRPPLAAPPLSITLVCPVSRCTSHRPPKHDQPPRPCTHFHMMPSTNATPT